MKNYLLAALVLFTLLIVGSTATKSEAQGIHFGAGGVHVDIGNPHRYYGNYSTYYGGYNPGCGYGGYGRYPYTAYSGGGWGGHAHWHDTTHLDYHPAEFVRHRNHYDYVPGHYDVHHDGHWDFHD
jgi:hypothetical protein